MEYYKILQTSSLSLQQQALQKDEEEEELLWKIPLLRGKVETLFGHARLELGQLEEAYLSFQQALKHYGL